ncbi:hypothetical protein ES705_38061 [subsurface metagenome]
MKKKRLLFRRYTFLVFTLLSFSVSNAQDFIIGAKLGMGNSFYKRQSDELETARYLTQKYALSFEYSPYFSRFLIVSGIEFDKNSLGSTVTIPLGFRITVGKSVQPFIEGGGYYTVNLKDKSEEYILKNHIGVRIGLGIFYKINRNWRIEAGYFWKFGLAPGLDEEILLPGNQVEYEHYNLYGQNIELSVKYLF